MKKILLMVVTAMIATVNVNAQTEYDNEIAIAYGGGANTDIVSSIAKGMFTGKQTSYWGPISAEYFHRLNNNRVGIGGVFVVGGCKFDDSKDSKSTYFTIMPAVKYNWSVKKHISWYSKGAVGVTLRSQKGGASSKDDSSATFNFQASLVGVEYGSAFRVFGELGIGEQGIILGGFRYKF